MDKILPLRKSLPLIALALVTLACRSASVLTPAAPQLEATQVSGYIFDLPASQGWSQTGIRLRQGQTFQIAYLSGQVRDGKTALADAAGSGYVCGHAGCCEPLPKVPRDALIGRVDQDIFYIGNGGTFTASDSGILELRLNDCDAGLYDNAGTLRLILIP